MSTISRQMGTQLISFRLKDEEVALLMQYADPEENPNLTAQRIIRHLLGTAESSPDRLTTFLTQVNEFQEQVKSVKVNIDETINERLEAVDKVVDDAVYQDMQAEESRVQGRFDKFEQRLDKYFQILRASGQLPTPKKKRSELPTEPLNETELAQRLINPKTGQSYSVSAISRQKNRANFPLWSEARDPQGVAWQYEPNEGLFYPLEPSGDFLM
ncbi:MAG: hypothetical protein AB1589_19185 [Cyanobacteriota bacterium]